MLPQNLPLDTGAAQEGGGKRKGPLSSLIYGTEEGRELDKDIERSFSQVLARGKYVHSIVFHEVKPDKVDEYVELIGGWYPYIAGVPEHKVHLVGSWRTEVGDCDTFGKTHIYIYHHLFHIQMQLLTGIYSSYLGIPEIPRLSLVLVRHPPSSRVPGIRGEAQDPHQLQEHFSDAGVFLLAHHAATPARRTLRTSIVYSTSWQLARVGDSLAARAEGSPRGHGRSRGVVRADWGAEHCASSVAVCRSRREEGAA